MDALTFFGLFAVSAMLVCYALESQSHWFVLLFAVSCALGSVYGFLQGLGRLGWSRRSGQPSLFGAGSWCETRDCGTNGNVCQARLGASLQNCTRQSLLISGVGFGCN
jgi:hypothetical protein